MYSVLKSYGLNGLNGFAVAVEADVSGGLPAFSLVGLPDSAVRESGDRVRSAVKNLGYKWPDRHITVNLAPADIRKSGPVYDLPLLLAVLAASGQLEPPPKDTAFLGELAGILSREDLFFERFNLHILECDCEVQQDTRLTTLAELTDWLRTMTLHGGGGTDFRPAFRYVDGLVERGEFAHLPGLLYFTDGYGVFPDVPPAYRAVFVMLRYRYDDIDLPAWAEKLILEAEAPKGDERWI